MNTPLILLLLLSPGVVYLSIIRPFTAGALVAAERVSGCGPLCGRFERERSHGTVHLPRPRRRGPSGFDPASRRRTEQ
jgi:hypothetical protein